MKSSDKSPENVKKYSNLKNEIIDILKKPVWRTVGSPLVSDQEGLDMAYSNNPNIYNDGTQKNIFSGD